MSTCDVCCETLNASTRSRVACPYCPFSACATCTEKYLMDTSDDPHCMNCRKAWSREILCNNLTSKFVTRTFKARRENLLFERERSMMPATQPYVEAVKSTRRYRSLITLARDEIFKLTQQQHTVRAVSAAVIAVQYNLASEIEGRVERARQTFEIFKKIKLLELDVKFYENCIAILTRDGAAEPALRRQFVRACPFDDCTGFLSTAWKCGLCENWACPECHEVKGLDKDADHVCNPDSIATARMLEKDSRPCPKCASVIFKIDGCDQMWCTQCHTAFSWSKGTIETHVIHNPHYYEWMRTNGTLPRAAGDVPCGGLPTYGQIHRGNQTVNPQLGNIHRNYGHVNHVIIPRYRTNAVEDNRDLRINFMLRDYTEEVFKRKLQQREKSRQKKTEIRQVLEMYQTVTVDLLQSHVQGATDVEEAFERLRIHVNEELLKISKRFTNCSVPTINENFVIF